VVLYINIKKILNINKESVLIKTIRNSPIIQKLSLLIRDYILKSPEYLYTQVTRNKDLQPILEKPASYFTAYCYYTRIIIIGFIALPLMIVSTCFIISIIYYHNLHYFFNSLLLLIPVLFMKLWLFVVESYSKRRLDHLSGFLDIFYITNEKRYKIQLKQITIFLFLKTLPYHKLKANFWFYETY